MRFKGEDSEINLHTEKPEFVEWKWVKLKSITELVIPFKKAVYESIVEQFFWIVDSDIKRWIILKKNIIYKNCTCINLTSIFLIDLKIPKDIMFRNIELIFKFNLYSG